MELSNLPNGMKLRADPLVYLHEHFKNHNKKSNTPLQNNWVWFSKEDLEAILEMIKKLDNPATEQVGDGVRLYYGIYNKRVCEYLNQLSANEPNPRDFTNYEGHNTTFFVPTYKGAEKDEHLDAITTQSVAKIKNDYANDASIDVITSRMKGNVENIMQNSDEKDFEGGYNVGNICPPPLNPGGHCKTSGSNL